MEINQNGKWLSIVEYSLYRNISVSSVRRYIKSDKVQCRLIKGKYYVWATNYYKKLADQNTQDQNGDLALLLEQNNQLKEENQELKMLVQLYERRQNDHVETPPEIPFN